MMYGSWDMKCNRQNFFVILGHFLPFYPPLTAQKMKISKMKKHLEISSFYTSVLKIMIIGYTVDMKRDRCNYYFYFEQYNSLLPPYSSKIENFKTMKKRPADIIILHTCTKNHYHMLYYFWDMACVRCNYFHFGQFFALLPP